MSSKTKERKPPVDERTRREPFSPRTLDRDNGTVEAVVSTENPVRRRFGVEILSHATGAIDLSRGPGAPVLDSHDRTTIRSSLGFVESAYIRDRQLVATIRFSESPEGKAAQRKVAEGAIRSVSVGYEIIEIDETVERDGSIKQVVTRWRLLEVSLVPVGADDKARFRVKEKNMNPDDVEDLVDTDEPEPPQRPARRPAATANRSRSIAREIEQIRRRATVNFGLPEADVDDLLDGVQTVDAANRALLDELAERASRTQTRPNHNPHGRDDESEQVRSTVTDEFAIRWGEKAGDTKRPLANLRPVGIGRHYFESTGISTRSFDDTFVARMMTAPSSYRTRAGAFHTTSDFPDILGDAANRALLDRYRDQPSVLKALSQFRPARDFRPQSFIRPGEAPRLEKLGENSEVKRGTLSEEKNGLTVETYAKMFGLSHKAIVNDDLGAFADFIRAFAESAAETEGDLFYGLLSANGLGGVKLQDGKNFFHADHGNLAQTPATINSDSLSAARSAMRLQTNVNGTGRAGVVPAVIVVGPAKETAAEKAVAEIAATTSEEVNPFGGKLRVAVENRYQGNGWWLFADPATRPALMHGYLEGRDGPEIHTREGWDVLGTEFRCILDFGCGVLDWRAAYFNPGA